MALSAITRLPVSTRTRWLRKISANANAPGAGKKQIRRSRKGSMSALTTRLGIYPIESNVTGPLAASVGGASPATISTGAGTPASTSIAASELDPVTWAAPGTKDLSVTAPAGVAGEAQVAVT